MLPQPVGPFAVAEDDLGPAVTQPVLELGARPPGVQRDDHAAGGGRRPERDRPLREVAHCDRHTVALPDAEAVDQRAGEGGRGPVVLGEAQLLVLVDDEGGLAVGPAQLEDRPQARWGVLPHSRGPPGDLHLLDLEQLAGSGEGGGGVGDGQCHGRQP